MEDAFVVGVVSGERVQAPDYAGDVRIVRDFFFHPEEALQLPVGFAHLGAGGVFFGRPRVKVAGEGIDHLIDAGAVFRSEDGGCRAEPVLDGVAGNGAFAFGCFRTGGGHFRRPYPFWAWRRCGESATFADESGRGGNRRPAWLRCGRF